MSTEYGFATKRLIVEEWHKLEREGRLRTELPLVVRTIMTPAVTASLPVSWQGPYTRRRAQNWIEERDGEGTTLLVVERSTAEPVGLLVLFEGDSLNLRIGYMLAETAWGKGFATELIHGLVGWCRDARKRTIVAGVAAGNLASQRVLTKCAFSPSPGEQDSAERFFELRL